VKIRPLEEQFQHKFQIIKDHTHEIRESVEMRLQCAALGVAHGLLLEEMEKLCGKRFSRKGDDLCHRGGSDPGSIILRGQRVKIKKPRVKCNGGDVELESYRALRGYDLLQDKVQSMMLSGVSTRNYDYLLDEIKDGLGLSKSTVSRAFLRGSKQALEEINGRNLSEYQFVSIMFDGIEIGDRCVIAALGITDQGRKLLIGLREGNTENSEVCGDLIQSLIVRNLNTQNAILFVLDGSKALKKAIKKVFCESPIQRCVRHKERNILEYIPHNYQMEFRRRWKMIHGIADYQIAQREMNNLSTWLGHINYAAQASLEEAEGETLTVIQLKIPRTLRKTLMSTNPIESLFSIAKPKINRVKNWKSSPNQVSRWAAITLLDAEKSFRHVTGYREIPILKAELGKLAIENYAEVA